MIQCPSMTSWRILVSLYMALLDDQPYYMYECHVSMLLAPVLVVIVKLESSACCVHVSCLLNSTGEFLLYKDLRGCFPISIVEPSQS